MQSADAFELEDEANTALEREQERLKDSEKGRNLLEDCIT